MCLQLVFVIIVKACHFVIFFFQKSLIVFIIHKKVLIFFFLAFFLYKNSHLFQIFCLKTIKLEPCFTYYMV